MAWEEKYDIHWLLRWYHITELDTARIIAAAAQVVETYLRGVTVVFCGMKGNRRRHSVCPQAAGL